MEQQKNEEHPLQINTSDETSKGRYSNTMLVAHGPDEFIIDWVLNSPNGAHLVSRVIVAPGHMKRICAALQENLRIYEDVFGEIRTGKATDAHMIQ